MVYKSTSSASESDFEKNESKDGDYAGSASEEEEETELAAGRPSRRNMRNIVEIVDKDNDEDEASSTGEEEEQTVAGSSRLSQYKKPKISAKKPRRQYMVDSKKDKGKATVKGLRNFGKLAHLMNMSLDILFEITSHLQPLDILQLSRVSKQFSSLFASKKGSRHIWVAAKRNLDTEMPECPADLSEPQYISLMFEHNCQACGKSRAPKTDYALRVRFCGHCFDENVIKGLKVLRSFIKVPDSIFRLVPRSRLKLSNVTRFAVSAFEKFDSAENGSKNAYYFPEIEAVITRYKELESDTTALRAFVKEHEDTARQMMKDATVLANWVENNKANKMQTDAENMKSRRSSIEAKLVELGWTIADFPKGYNYEWRKLFDQPRELTPRIWKLIQPKLEALIKAEQEKKAMEELCLRSELRKMELKSIWADYSKTTGQQGIRTVMPNHLDVCEFSSVKELLFENDSSEPFTRARWDTVADCLPNEIETFRTNVIYTLTKCLDADAASVGHYHSNRWEEYSALKIPDPEEVVDHHILEKASSLFRCFHYSCKDILPGLEGIMGHSHFQELRWNEICSKLYGDSNTVPVVNMILKVLQLPEDSTFEMLRTFDEKLVCLCGHPDHRQPKTIVALVSHILIENKIYKEHAHPHYISGSIDLNKHGIALYNDHDPNGDPLVALACDVDFRNFKVPPENSSESSEDNNGFSSEVPYFKRKSCKYCFVLHPGRTYFNSKDEMNYHMRAKHHRERVEDDEALNESELIAWKLALRDIAPEDIENYKSRS